VMGRAGLEGCPVCGGKGVRVVDSYTGAAVGDVETGPVQSEDFWRRRQRREDRDRAIERVELEELHRAGLVAPSERLGWERAKEVLWRQGSFAELEKALSALRRVSEYDWAAVNVVYGYDAPLRRVGPLLQERADAAVALLARLMPDPIRVPSVGELDVARRALGNGRAPAHARARSARDEEVRRLKGQGLGQAAIGRKTGLSQSAVSRILSREEAA
jgi:hypothetical protein